MQLTEVDECIPFAERLPIHDIKHWLYKGK